MSAARAIALRDARSQVGLSQAALAAAAGISRQAVGAIEGGRHRPGVDAALRIAQAVGRPVEELFGTTAQPAVPVLTEEAREGVPVLAAWVGERLVHAPAAAGLSVEGWPQPNAVVEDGRPRLLPGADFGGFVVVGCDPAIGLAAAMSPGQGPRRVMAVSGSSAIALAALRDGRTHAAVVHSPAERLPSPPVDVLRFHLARWRVGLASRGQRARTVAEVCGPRVRVVQRENGAESQKAFAAAVAAAGGSVPPGPVVGGHLDVARRVAAGAAAGVTMEPAAVSCGLAFEPLEEHVSEVWVDARWREHPATEALGSLLRSAAFTTRLDLVGGYELAGCGSMREEHG